MCRSIYSTRQVGPITMLFHNWNKGLTLIRTVFKRTQQLTLNFVKEGIPQRSHERDKRYWIQHLCNYHASMFYTRRLTQNQKLHITNTSHSMSFSKRSTTNHQQHVTQARIRRDTSLTLTLAQYNFHIKENKYNQHTLSSSNLAYRRSVHLSFHPFPGVNRSSEFVDDRKRPSESFAGIGVRMTRVSG